MLLPRKALQKILELLSLAAKPASYVIIYYKKESANNYPDTISRENHTPTPRFYQSSVNELTDNPITSIKVRATFTF